MFLSKYFFFIIKNSKRLSVSSAGACLLALLLALFGAQLSFLVPQDWADLVERDALHEILTILASSMLLVVTFSLSTMVSAYVAASEGVTPRAAKLLMEDQSSQRILAVFLSAFIFSMVTLAMLSTTYYQDEQIFVLFFLTLSLITLVVWTIIGWIEKLSKLGRVHETIRRVEHSTRQAMESRIRDIDDQYPSYKVVPKNLEILEIEDIGYLQSVGYESIYKICKKHEAQFFLTAQPGTYLSGSTCVGYLALKEKKDDNAKVVEDLRRCFAVGSSRYFENDPRFGLITLSEVASRALSPAVNDSGTAIDVVGSMIRLFCFWDKTSRKNSATDTKDGHLFVQQLEVQDFFDDIVRSLSRDGSAHIEVVIRLYKALDRFGRLKGSGFQESTKIYKKIVKDRAMASLPDDADRAMFKKVIDDVSGLA